MSTEPAVGPNAWEEQPPSRVTIPDELVDPTPTALAEDVTRLESEIERVARSHPPAVPSVPGGTVGAFDEVLGRVIADLLVCWRSGLRGARTSARRMSARDHVDLSEALVDSACSYRGALEKD